MSDKMIEIKGKKISEKTIIEALKDHIDFEEETYGVGSIFIGEYGNKCMLIYNHAERYADRHFDLLLLDDYSYQTVHKSHKHYSRYPKDRLTLKEVSNIANVNIICIYKCIEKH